MASRERRAGASGKEVGVPALIARDRHLRRKGNGKTSL